MQEKRKRRLKKIQSKKINKTIQRNGDNKQMSESRKECYKCLNNKKCTHHVIYDSVYCKNNKKFKVENTDNSKEKNKKKN